MLSGAQVAVEAQGPKSTETDGGFVTARSGLATYRSLDVHCLNRDR
jgi:hypothetical protein